MSHIAKPSLYLTVFGALIMLTLATVGVTYIDLGEANLFVALAIAVTKATLVILIFMHAWWSERLIHLTIITALCFIAILASLSFADYFTRNILGVMGK